MTSSSEAFKYFILGVNEMMNDEIFSCIDWLQRAIQTDTAFVKAYLLLAHAYISLDNLYMARELTKKAKQR